MDSKIAKHVAGARESVEKQQLRRSSSSSFPIEDLEAVHVGSLVLDGSHGVSPLSRSVTALDSSKGLSRGTSRDGAKRVHV
jgi:hypothetical protein